MENMIIDKVMSGGTIPKFTDLWNFEFSKLQKFGKFVNFLSCKILQIS